MPLADIYFVHSSRFYFTVMKLFAIEFFDKVQISFMSELGCKLHSKLQKKTAQPQPYMLLSVSICRI